MLRVEPKKERVYVEGLNIVKRHQRPQRRDAQRAETVGGVIEREGPIHVSNVMLIDPKDDKPTRVGIEIEDGKRYGSPPHRNAESTDDRHARTARLKTATTRRSARRSIERFGYSTPMQAPRIVKVTVNMGVGDAKQDSKMLDAATRSSSRRSPASGRLRRARKSIAEFKLREGMPVGVAVTLRGERAYEFLDRLMSIAIPRIRDFRGSTRARSTAAATTRWACASRSSSRRSTTTRSTRSAGWTSRS